MTAAMITADAEWWWLPCNYTIVYTQLQSCSNSEMLTILNSSVRVTSQLVAKE